MNLLFVLKYTQLTGVGTFNYTLIKDIKENYPEFKVDVWFQSSNEDSLLIRQLSNITDNIYFSLPKSEYDIVYTNYSHKDYPKTKRIYHFVHNLMSNDYMNEYADKVFVFGERSYDYVKHSNKELIRNGIDLKRFKYVKPKKNADKVLVFDSRNNAFLNSKVLAACLKKNMYMSFLGENLNHNVYNRWDVENYIKSSDIVIAVGRSAIEAMAMGKTVIIGNSHQVNGIVTEDNFWEHAETNFSGWTKYRKDEFDYKYFIKEFNKFNSNSLRNIIKGHYNINDYTQKIIAL